MQTVIFNIAKFTLVLLFMQYPIFNNNDIINNNDINEMA
jgi:hypothetical protein